MFKEATIMEQPVVDEDKRTVRQIVQHLQESWNTGDGEAFAAPFAADADYTVWNGHYLKGRKAIAESHQHIFDTIYRDTVQKLEIAWMRFLRSDVAVAQVHGGLVNDKEWPTVKPLLVLSKKNGRWQIAVLQNTPIMPQTRDE